MKRKNEISIVKATKRVQVDCSTIFSLHASMPVTVHLQKFKPTQLEIRFVSTIA